MSGNKKQEKIDHKQKWKNNNQEGNSALRSVDSFNSYFSGLIKKDNQKQKVKMIDEIIQKYGEFMGKFGLKKLSSKVIQRCIKLGNEKQKEQIMKWLMKENLIDLMKSKYGKFIVKKMIKYGNKEDKQKIWKVMNDEVHQLIGHQEGIVLVDYFMNNCEQNQKRGLKDRIMGKQQEEVLENVAMKIVEKGLLKYQISYMILNKTYGVLVEQERQKIDEQLGSTIIPNMNSKDCLQLAINIINNYDNKQRKQLMKQLKPNIIEYMSDTYKSQLVFKLIVTIDDTKLLNKLITKQIVNHDDEHMNRMMNDVNTIKVIKWIVNYELDVNSDLEQIDNKYSKKDKELRNHEVMDEIYDSILDYSINNLNTQMVLDNSYHSIIQGLIKYMDRVEIKDQSRQSKLNEFQYQIIEVFSQDHSLLDHNHAHRLLKSMVTENKENQEVLEQIYQLLIQNIKTILECRSRYVIMAMVEHTSYKDKLLKQLKKSIESVKRQDPVINVLKKLIQ